MRERRKILSFLFAIILVIASIPVQVTAKSYSVKLKKTSITLTITEKNGKLTYGKSKIKVEKAKGVKVKKITYKSANKKIATVNKKGKVTAKKKGNTKIKVTLKYIKNKKKYTKKLAYKVKVNEVKTTETNTARNTTEKAKNTTEKTEKEKTEETIICTVKFETNGGSEVPSQTIQKNSKANQPVNPTKEGYTFDGWYTAAIDGQKFDFNTAITENLTIYAHWRDQNAEEYYGTHANILEIKPVGESEDVLTEAQVKSVLESRGFGDYPITFEYYINGNYMDETAIVDSSSDKHPMYQTFYMNNNQEVWTVYLINGEVFANPVSFNLESDLNAQLLVSESETLTSYDDESNKFYSTIPYASAAIIESVDKIDAETLDRLTIAEICKKTGAAVPVSSDEEISNDELSSALSGNSSNQNLTTENTQNVEDDPLIVVSLGDSYSSGEGIEEFYGQNNSVSEKVKDNNWLAHRSTKSWPSMIEIPGVKGTMSDYRVEFGETSTDNIQWYFGAVSGAETKHFKKVSQVKTYNKKIYDRISLIPYNISGSFTMPKQLNIFDSINGDVDYVTLTIGGNDVNFAGVITKCVTESSYLKFGKTTGLEKMLNNLWDNIGTTMDNIKQVYKDIEDKAGPQAAIIVAGYPELLDYNGKGFAISKQEATLVNDKVRAFNDEIKKLVESCHSSRMNIYFVDVAKEFETHQAFSKNAWINPVWLIPKSQDLDELSIGSAYSVHPNAQGAKAYAKCVNAKIKEIKNNKANNNLQTYKEILFKYKKALYEGWDGEKLYENNMNYQLMYLNTYYDDDFEIVYTSSEQRLNKIAYTFEDLNNDGIDELMIFNVEQNDMIYDLYSVVDDEVTLIISSGERNRYHLCEDGFIVNEGSSSASTFVCAVYHYTNGDNLDFIDMIFFNSDYDQKNPWYYSNTLNRENYSNPISQKESQEFIDKHECRILSGSLFSEYN